MRGVEPAKLTGLLENKTLWFRINLYYFGRESHYNEMGKQVRPILPVGKQPGLDQ